VDASNQHILPKAGELSYVTKGKTTLRKGVACSRGMGIGIFSFARI
jgi:hypothetical protein